ncbi:hypothetical protein BCR39DRAFT_530979 [Naematelia encephala]|uniref:Uncharacterized protein n=1 Tax=Naematelia encephala TaxID=71784 RepID=A0A1Y2B5F5_9TREE|nr:hypothetical protein BCR39DRAFT_530979 [Naematelia encephala]
MVWRIRRKVRIVFLSFLSTVSSASKYSMIRALRWLLLSTLSGLLWCAVHCLMPMDWNWRCATKLTGESPETLSAYHSGNDLGGGLATHVGNETCPSHSFLLSYS